jgi:nitronate monooxygenase
MILDDITEPIVLAPLAGGPSTPELVAAVCGAGAFGFLAAGYLSAEQLAAQLRALRGLTDRPFGVNLFCPPAAPAPPAAYAGYVERLRAWARPRGLPLGEPRFSEDAYEDKLDLVLGEPAAVVSFTFGCPDRPTVARLHDRSSEVWVTVTTPHEAAVAASAGADVLVAQGVEAGGHRGSFVDDDGDPRLALMPLLQLIRSQVDVPIVAAGGICTGAGIAAALAAGAGAVQLGTAFLLAPEAGTSAAQRHALMGDARTVLTRAFTGRTARGIHNAFIAEHEAHAVHAYPEVHYVTQPLRAGAREAGDSSMINLWAGQAYRLARAEPAADVVRRLAAEVREEGLPG